MSLPIIKNDIQDRNTVAWKQLCRYIDQLAEEGGDEFSPLEAVGLELFAQIHTLPESIAKLKKVKKVWLYGSQLKRIPPEIGAMESLEYFDPYTSYDLHWFPYEITYCKNLKDSRVSTRALYGNYKHRMLFPNLIHNPIRYSGDTVPCSVCRKDMSYTETNQVWVSLEVGTDVLPLLVNLCSKECQQQLPSPPENYIPFPHKGGPDIKQPPTEDEHWEQYRQTGKKPAHWKMISLEEWLDPEEKPNEAAIVPPSSPTKLNIEGMKGMKLLKLVRKIWEK